MTPEAIRVVSQLRGEFYSLFAGAMNVPVRITGKSYSNFPLATWLDRKQRLNYVNVYAYTAPDEFIPQRPFLLRISINKSAGRITLVKQGQECRGVNREWYFELTVLPEEILDFLPWTVSLVKAHDQSSPTLVKALVKEPPHSFDCKIPQVLLFHQAWTEQAWRIAAAIMPQQLEG